MTEKKDISDSVVLHDAWESNFLAVNLLSDESGIVQKLLRLKSDLTDRNSSSSTLRLVDKLIEENLKLLSQINHTGHCLGAMIYPSNGLDISPASKKKVTLADINPRHH